MTSRTASPTFPGAGALRETGRLFALALDVVVNIFRRPFQVREFIQQCWFIASVTILPTALVAIPFGAVVALELGSLIVQLGAQSFTGAAAVLAIIQQAAPLVTALIVAGAGGTAICADLGARTIREEIDAMEVLGINALHRLGGPRVLASVFMASLLNALIILIGLGGGFLFSVFLQGATPGLFIANLNLLVG